MAVISFMPFHLPRQFASFLIRRDEFIRPLHAAHAAELADVILAGQQGHSCDR
jgi:hypothetical protein